MEIRVGTLNILNTCWNHPARKPWVSKTIDAMDCDILGIQEVNLLGNNEVQELPNYNFEFVRMTNPLFLPIPDFRIDGNAFLIKKDIEVLERYELHYSITDRIAHAVKLRRLGTEFVIANTHLDHLADFIREHQTKELVDFLAQFKGLPVICTGDFNFVPESEAYKVISHSFLSAHVEANGKEPEKTSPTGLEEIDKADLVPMVVDYIWIQGNIKCNYCQVFSDCGEGTVWASDHFPIVADIKFQEN